MPRRDRPTRWLFRLGHAPPRPSDEVGWEIEHYLAEQTDRLVEEGWDAEDARREAERRFGSLSGYRSRLERIDRRRMMMRRMGTIREALLDGFRDAARTFRRSPGFALGVVATLGLGLGANAAMFSIVDRLLLRPPDHVTEAERVRLVGVTRSSSITGEASTSQTLTFPDVQDLEESRSFQVAAYAYPQTITLGTGQQAASVRARLVSHDFFSLLGASPLLGRTFDEDDERIGAPLTAILSHGFWTRRFGADREVLGRTLELSGNDYTVIGVAPEGFTGVTLEPVDLWLPLRPTQALLTSSTEWRDHRQWWWLSAVVRLDDGATVAAAQDEATGLHRAARQEMIDAGHYSSDARIELQPLIAAAGTPEGRVTKWLLGVAFVVLLIACANVANLLVARGARRRRESAVRLALGSSRRRLVVQRSVEAVALALVGGGVALLLARWGTDQLAQVLLPDVLFSSVVNARVVGFTLIASLLAGLLAGVIPAVQGGGGLAGVISERSRGSSGRRSRIRGVLTMAQAALSVVLLVGAGLFVRSLDEVRSLDLGLDVDRVALATLEFTADGLTDAEETEIHRRAAERIRQLPSVRSAAIAYPPFRSAFATGIRVNGVDSIPNMPGGGPYSYGVGESYFEALGLEILQGRGFEPSDDAGGQPVAVVSRTMADSLWDGSALGGCILLIRAEEEECITVVGVVEDASRGSIEWDPYFAWYRPIDQIAAAATGLYARVDGDPEKVAGDISLALRTFSPQVRFARVRGLREILDPQARSWTLGATMFTVFGVLALVVAAVGLYSLLAFQVAERTRELGIRTALGAARAALLRGVVVDGLRMVGGGVVVGLAAAWLAAPWVEDLLFEVEPRDPAVLGAVAVLLVVVALGASLVPGWRATRVDPMQALKTE